MFRLAQAISRRKCFSKWFHLKQPLCLLFLVKVFYDLEIMSLRQFLAWLLTISIVLGSTIWDLKFFVLEFTFLIPWCSAIAQRELSGTGTQPVDDTLCVTSRPQGRWISQSNHWTIYGLSINRQLCMTARKKVVERLFQAIVSGLPEKINQPHVSERYYDKRSNFISKRYLKPLCAWRTEISNVSFIFTTFFWTW